MPKKRAKPNNDAKRRAAGLRAWAAELDGAKLTKQQTRDLAWIRSTVADDIVDQLLRKLPKGAYCELAGRQHKVVDDAAERYDLPLLGPTVDLYAAVKSLHDRLIELAARARPDLDGTIDELREEKLRQEIRKLESQAEMLTLEIGRRRDELVERQVVQNRLAWLSGQLTGLGQRMRSQVGPEAAKLLNDFLANMAAELESGSLRL